MYFPLAFPLGRKFSVVYWYIVRKNEKTYVRKNKKSTNNPHKEEILSSPHPSIAASSMPSVSPADLIKLQSNTSNIRNICVLAHVDHGATPIMRYFSISIIYRAHVPAFKSFYFFLLPLQKEKNYAHEARMQAKRR
jgi:hypothetical protein